VTVKINSDESQAVLISATMREIVDENNGDTLLKVLCVLLAEN